MARPTPSGDCDEDKSTWSANCSTPSVAVHPDWVRTEGVLQFADQVDQSASQSPEGVGRAIAALAGDPEVMGLTGQVLGVQALAERYGIDVSS